MCNVKMIRQEQGFISIPVTDAVYCESCEQVSNSASLRCGHWGSETILSLALLIGGPPNDPEPSAVVLCPVLIETAA